MIEKLISKTENTVIPEIMDLESKVRLGYPECDLNSIETLYSSCEDAVNSIQNDFDNLHKQVNERFVQEEKQMETELNQNNSSQEITEKTDDFFSNEIYNGILHCDIDSQQEVDFDNTNLFHQASLMEVIAKSRMEEDENIITDKDNDVINFLKNSISVELGEGVQLNNISDENLEKVVDEIYGTMDDEKQNRVHSCEESEINFYVKINKVSSNQRKKLSAKLLALEKEKLALQKTWQNLNDQQKVLQNQADALNRVDDAKSLHQFYRVLWEESFDCSKCEELRKKAIEHFKWHCRKVDIGLK